MSESPLLMIPGPVEVSPAVAAAMASPPPSHLAPELVEAFGSALENMRRVWRAAADDQPFVLAGGGTAAMEMAAANLVSEGDRVLVVGTGYFSDRMAIILGRYGAQVLAVEAPVGDAPDGERVRQALGLYGDVRVLFATHVDTSTGVRIDPAPLARLARERGILSVFDGVCATGGETFEMAEWGADVYLSASQKALSLPAGLALQVVSRRALEGRRRRAGAPPLYFDWEVWRSIMEAYEERRGRYFSTPATNLVLALDVGLREILEEGIEERVAKHQRASVALRAGWRELGLAPVPVRPDLAAHTLSALNLPEGVDKSLVAAIGRLGVSVAGGLHPEIADRYFRVGHMGYSVTRPDWLARVVETVGEALVEKGVEVDPQAARRAVEGLFP